MRLDGVRTIVVTGLGHPRARLSCRTTVRRGCCFGEHTRAWDIICPKRRSIRAEVYRTIDSERYDLPGQLIAPSRRASFRTSVRTWYAKLVERGADRSNAKGGYDFPDQRAGIYPPDDSSDF